MNELKYTNEERLSTINELVDTYRNGKLKPAIHGYIVTLKDLYIFVSKKDIEATTKEQEKDFTFEKSIRV